MHEWIVCDGCAVFQSPFMMKTMGNSDHEHPLLHVLFLVLQKTSSVSVVFDFNASLNDVAPVSPMSLPIYSKQHKIHETAFVKTVRLTISCGG